MLKYLYGNSYKKRYQHFILYCLQAWLWHSQGVTVIHLLYDVRFSKPIGLAYIIPQGSSSNMQLFDIYGQILGSKFTNSELFYDEYLCEIEDYDYLLYLGIHPKYQGGGRGSYLLQYCFSTFDNLVLDTTCKSLVEYYCKYDFQLIKTAKFTQYLNIYLLKYHNDFDS